MIKTKRPKDDIIFTTPNGSVIKLQFETAEYRAYKRLSDGKWNYMMLGATSADALKKYIMRREV